MRQAAAMLGVVLAGCAVESGGRGTDVDPATPEERGDVLHEGTGLYWKRCALAATWDGTRCAGQTTTLDWQAAIDACASLEGGDYRLPTVAETRGLLGACGEGAGAAQCAPCRESQDCATIVADDHAAFWTADLVDEPYADHAAGELAFVVDYRDGDIAFDPITRRDARFARCVREAP